MKSDSSRYCFPDLPEAFFIVVVLNMIEYLMNSIFLSADRSAGLQAIASIGRALANGLVFTVLLHHGKSTYRSLLHDSVDFWRTTIGRFLVPVLLTTPALVVAMSVLEVGVGQFFPWSGTRDEARDAYIHGGLGLIVLTCMIAPLLEEMQRDGQPARGLADFLVVRRARVGRCRRMGGQVGGCVANGAGEYGKQQRRESSARGDGFLQRESEVKHAGQASLSGRSGKYGTDVDGLWWR